MGYILDGLFWVLKQGSEGVAGQRKAFIEPVLPPRKMLADPQCQSMVCVLRGYLERTSKWVGDFYGLFQNKLRWSKLNFCIVFYFLENLRARCFCDKPHAFGSTGRMCQQFEIWGLTKWPVCSDRCFGDEETCILCQQFWIFKALSCRSP